MDKADGRSQLAPLRVLVVDDDATIRLLCRVNLEHEQMSVIEAASGVEAVELAATSPPDVVLLDVMMPGLDGWQVADRLRADPATEHVPLVFLTAVTDVDAQRRARDLDAGYMPKPFNPLLLPDVLRQAAARAGADS